MNALLLKDFYVITKQLKIFIVAILAMALAGGSSLATLSIFFGATIPLTAIAYDERAKWNELAGMLPYTKTEIILSKYILGYIGILGASILVFLGAHISKIFFLKNMNINYSMIIFAIMVALVFLAIQTFFVLKFGSEKGRIVLIITMVLVSASTSAGMSGDSLSTMLNNLQAIPPLVIFLCVIIINLVSIICSMNIKKSE